MIDFKGKGLYIGKLRTKLPIIQGGMGVGVSLSGLASAVANAGGVGVISAAGVGMFEKDSARDFLGANLRALRDEIKKAKANTKGVLGVNIMVAMSTFADMVKVSIEEKIDIIFAGAGLPLNLPSFISEGMETKLVPIVSSARAAGIIAKRWYAKYKYVPDAVVIEGPRAGGHLGFSYEQLDDPNYRLENIMEQVIDELKRVEDKAGRAIPVIAGGGIYTGEDIYNIMELGAAGVQMGTRFVTTHECDAFQDFKQVYLDAKEGDIGIIKSPVGMPGRAVVNSFIEDVDKGIRKPYKCPYHCIVTCDVESSPYCIALALMNAKVGKLKHGFAFAGENAYRAESIISVEGLMNTLTEEYNNAMDGHQ
ncbi:MAG TPA: nitronate monooxygenase family protein [Clostridia bacterium]|nr:nitronate monooxygenase family protein [Clostridia bacterium]